MIKSLYNVAYKYMKLYFLKFLYIQRIFTPPKQRNNFIIQPYLHLYVKAISNLTNLLNHHFSFFSYFFLFLLIVVWPLANIKSIKRFVCKHTRLNMFKTKIKPPSMTAYKSKPNRTNNMQNIKQIFITSAHSTPNVKKTKTKK